MKTLLISGRTPVPADLRDVIARGSTDVVERSASDVRADASIASSVDRLMFWPS